MSETPPDPLRFVDRVGLRELVDQYAQCVDRLDLERLVTLFAADGVLAVHGVGETMPPTAVRTGPDEIRAAMQSLRRYEITAHHLAQHAVRFVPAAAAGAPQAVGELYCTAHHVTLEGDQRFDRVLWIRYLDDYVVDHGRWRFARRRVCTDFLDEHPITG
jgi:hypothetical protein